MKVKVISLPYIFLGFVCFVLYKAKISGERLQDHWSSGLYFVLPIFFKHNLESEDEIKITRTVRGSDYSPAIELSKQKDKLVTATGDTEKYSEKQANKVWLNSVYWFSRY